MHKVFAIGHRRDVFAFKAVGAEVVAVEGPEEAAAALEEIAWAGEPCLVMLSEKFVLECAEAVETFRASRENVLVSIPVVGIAPGASLAAVRARVARSVGVDLLRGEPSAADVRQVS